MTFLRTPPTMAATMADSVEMGISNDSRDEEYGFVHHSSPGLGQWSWWRWDYLFDWGLIILIALVELSLTQFVFEPYDRFLPKDDPSLSYPLLPDTVPAWSLAFIDALGPMVFFGLFQLFLMRSSHDFHHACLGLTQSLIFTLIFTDCVKMAAGRYRPDWLTRLNRDDAPLVRDGRLSFPSGHSSIAFAGMVYLSLWLSGKMGLFRHHGGTSWKAIIALIPIGAATAVAVSRVMDYHHHFSDILGGSLLGSGIAIFSYFLNYHSLTSDKSHLPKLRVDQRVAYYHYYHPSSNGLSTD